MIPNIHQSIEDIIKQSTPGQRLFWEQIRLITGETASVRRTYYQGLIAGHEMLTYSATTLYLAYNISFGSLTLGLGLPYVNLFDENNVESYNAVNTGLVWNTTGAAINYMPNDLKLENCYFSRIVAAVYARMIFNGFKITY